jgi:hypothetical protein
VIPPPPPSHAHKPTSPSFIISRRWKRGRLHSWWGSIADPCCISMAQHESFLLIALRRTPAPDCNTNTGGRLRMQELTGCALRSFSYEQRLGNGHESTANFLTPPGAFVNTSRNIPKVTGNTLLQRFNPSSKHRSIFWITPTKH